LSELSGLFIFAFLASPLLAQYLVETPFRRKHVVHRLPIGPELLFNSFARTYTRNIRVNNTGVLVGLAEKVLAVDEL
jgi:hypothetical protein